MGRNVLGDVGGDTPIIKITLVLIGLLLTGLVGCVAWDMALDRMIAHIDRWSDDADKLMKARQ